MRRVANYRRYVAGLTILAVLIVFILMPRGTTAEAELPARNASSNKQAADSPTRTAGSQFSPPARQVLVKNKPLNQAPDSHSTHVVREEVRSMEPSLAELGHEFEAKPFGEIEIPLFDGQSARITGLRHTRMGQEGGVFTGRVAGDPGSHVVLSYVGTAESGTIHSPASGSYFDIRTAGDGSSSVLSQVDPAKVPPCALGSHGDSTQSAVRLP